jgi:hypothetical protein
VIAGLLRESIDNAQVSADGQWVLFTTSKGELQLVRIDGQGLQTLFCAPGNSIFAPQWSSDQQHIIFEVNQTSGGEVVYLLTVATGRLQTLLSIAHAGPGTAVSTGTWLDNHRVYLTNYQVDQPHDKIYVLDINHGSNQDVSLLPALVNQTFGDFDSSYNGQQLYVDYGYCGQGGCNPPSKVTVQSATGGTEKTILNETHYDVITVRAATPQALLLVIHNDQIGGGNISHNGLWKINPNGSGLTRLTTDQTHQSSFLNDSTRFPWSNVSRDNSLYAIEILTTVQGVNTYILDYGSLSGGTPTSFASASSNTTLAIAGWTTM